MGITIRTLGQFAVFKDGVELTRFSDQPTRAALLVYLALERDVTRDDAEGVIWPNLPPERARHSLNQTLYRLRKDLGERWLSAEGDRLRVTDSLSVDALEFIRKIETGTLDEALAQYAGGFLKGWHMLDTNAFEHWTDRQRIQYSRVHREACRSRLAELREAGRKETALELARGWVRKDPLEDEAHHALIELLALGGNRAEALERYEAYNKILAQEDLTPLDETIALVEGIRRGDSPTTDGWEPRPEEAGPETSARPDPAEARHQPDPTSGPADSRRQLDPASKRLRKTPMGLVALLAIPGLLLWVLLFGLPGASDPVPTVVANRVLVFPLENQTGNPSLDPIGRLVADWITQGLAGAEFLEVVPSNELMSGFVTQGGDPRQENHSVQGRAVAEETQSGNLVTGTFYASGSGLEFHVQILEAPGWGVLESLEPVRTSSTDPTEILDVLRQRVLISMTLHRNQSLGGILSESALPPSYPAYLAYAEGARKMSVGDWRGAANDLMRANELSPEFTAPLIYAGFAVIAGWGDYFRADSLAQVVEASFDRLPAYDRLRLELLQATLEGDNPRAYEAVRQAAAIVPGGAAHYSTGQRALQLNRPREALAVLSTWDPTREAVRQWTPYWNVVTGAHHILGDHEAELEEARKGRRQIPDRLETLWYEVRALAALGRLGEVSQLLEESLRMRSTPTIHPGAVMYWAAEELLTHGHVEAGEAALARFDTWYEGEDALSKERRGLRILAARVAYAKGEFEAARTAFMALLSEDQGDPFCLRYLGAIAARAGDETTAREYSDALTALDRPYLFGEHTRGRAAMAALLGEREEAVTLLRRSVAEGVTFGPGLLSDTDFLVLRDYPPYQEFLRPEG